MGYLDFHSGAYSLKHANHIKSAVEKQYMSVVTLSTGIHPQPAAEMKENDLG